MGYGVWDTKSNGSGSGYQVVEDGKDMEAGWGKNKHVGEVIRTM